MIGMGSVVTKSIGPFSMAYGNPVRIRGGNIIGMQRAGLEDSLIAEVVKAIDQSDVEMLRKLIPDEMTRFDAAKGSQNH
jgi:UDP-N-acetylglucosamine acyltransferase